MASLRGRTIPRLWAITPEQAWRIRRMYLEGATLRQLQEQYHVSYGTVQSVISGRHRALDGAPAISRHRGGRR